MFDICVRYLCVACVPADLGRFGWISGVSAGFWRETAVREPEKTGDTGGVRVCGTRAVTGGERGSRDVWRFQREFGGTGGVMVRGKGGNNGVWGCGGDDGKSIRRKDWHIELFNGMNRPDPATFRAHCPKG